MHSSSTAHMLTPSYWRPSSRLIMHLTRCFKQFFISTPVEHAAHKIYDRASSGSCQAGIAPAPYHDTQFGSAALVRPVGFEPTFFLIRSQMPSPLGDGRMCHGLWEYLVTIHSTMDTRVDPLAFKNHTLPTSWFHGRRNVDVSQKVLSSLRRAIL